MSFLDSIKTAIWGKAEAATPEDTATAAAAAEATAAEPVAAPTRAPAPAAAAPTTAPAVAPAAAPAAEVDVTAILDAAVKRSGQKLDWRKSIVDLLKALDLDSSLARRKELAAELGYTGDTADSASMNIWLHKQVMDRLKASGGRLPEGF